MPAINRKSYDSDRTTYPKHSKRIQIFARIYLKIILLSPLKIWHKGIGAKRKGNEETAKKNRML